MADAGDRRRAPRARFSGIALVRAEDFDINCVGGDISESGMLLYPTVPPPVLPTRLRVTFALPSSSRWLVIDAELVRAKRVARRTIWAVRFTLMSDETREVLRRYIHENDLGRAAGIVMPEHGAGAELLDLQPLARSSPGEPQPTQTPSGNVDLPELPSGPAEEREISIEAQLPDPDTLMLSADEVDHLAAASLLIEGQEQVPPPPPVEALFDDDEDEEDTEVRDVESLDTNRAPRPPTGPMPPLFKRRD